MTELLASGNALERANAPFGVVKAVENGRPGVTNAKGEAACAIAFLSSGEFEYSNSNHFKSCNQEP